MLWDSIQRDWTCLFWRSRLVNRINPWYVCGIWFYFMKGFKIHNLTHYDQSKMTFFLFSPLLGILSAALEVQGMANGLFSGKLN